MRNGRVWAGLLGVERSTVERVEFDVEEGLLVAHVRPARGERGRCGVCRRRCPGYDRGQGRRRWRALDLGTVRAVLEADAPRVRCPEHGPTVAAVPWARHGAGHTYGFDDTVAWLAVQCSKTAVCELLRIAWRTVGAIVARYGPTPSAAMTGSTGCAESESMRFPIARSALLGRYLRPHLGSLSITPRLRFSSSVIRARSRRALSNQGW